ncbi:MAG: TolC family protein [Flavobacteriales bacterium]|nr:TolC family protein [Flavobacteriales bacterium]
MMSFRSIWFLVYFLLSLSGSAQVVVKSLTYDNYIAIVRDHHPVMIQANETVHLAEGNLLEARGVFDPVIKGGMEQKEYDDKKYFQLIDAGLVVPTWVGVDLKLGYTQSIGDYISAMDKMPTNGLVYAGVSIPIGQGLFYDKRRTNLDKAKTYLSMAGDERKLMINEIIYQASADYWNWFETYHQKMAIEDLLKKSRERLDNILTSAKIGDVPYVDTLEAAIQYQNYQSLLMEYETAEKNARSYVNVHLWADGLVPLELGDETNPEDISATEIDLDIFEMANDTLIWSHPKLNIQQSKLVISDIELRMAKESLKPKLNLNYNLLNEPVGGDLVGFNPSDYKFGLDLEIPIFLRNARGQLQAKKAEMLINETELKLNKEELKAKFISTVNNSKNELDQAKLLSEIVMNYRNLVQAERKLFESGESSLMMLNYREIALLQAEVKWIEKVSKSNMAALKIVYALGQLN